MYLSLSKKTWDKIGEYALYAFMGSPAIIYFLVSVTDIADIGLRLLFLPIEIMVIISISIFMIIISIYYIFLDKKKYPEKIRINRLIGLPILSIFGILMIYTFLFNSESPSYTNHISYALNQSQLKTHTATITKNDGQDGMYGALTGTYHDLTTEDGTKLKHVHFIIPKPHLQAGKTYKLTMTPELDTIVKAEMVEIVK